MSFDLEKLRISPDKKIKVTPVLNTIVVGKPNKTDFFRVRTGEGWEDLEMFVFASNEGKDHTPYLVYPETEVAKLLIELGLLIPCKFYMYQVYSTGILKIDYVSQKPDKTGLLNRYHVTHLQALEEAKNRWIRMYTNQEGGYYVWALAEDSLPEPVWPEKPATLGEAIEIAFRGYLIEGLDHPEIKKLRGKI